jgi:Flp pilus assembly protein TadD
MAQRAKSFRRAAVVVVLTIATAVVFLSYRSEKANSPDAALTYIGAERCAACHAQMAELWRQSHHAQAMDRATDATVLGNFQDAQFTKDGVTSTFHSRDGKRYVRTDGPDGKLVDYPLAYTFGVSPLQQYLVEFPNGRLQSLAIAWDSRSTGQGGQRWFHLYPDQKIPPSDPLHWTGRNQNWNFMCAECHSTNLRKNYDLAKDSYATTWSDINVSCESCHGPGSRHEAWARSSSKGEDANKGLSVQLRSGRTEWQFANSSDGTMRWSGPPRGHTEVETCAPCHSRRYSIKSEHRPGAPFLDGYVPSLLDEGVYFADGQIQEEDYEYGSFVQSRMYQQGVTCSDCHNPHSLSVSSTNLNAVCSQCHQPAKFDSAEHHHHRNGSEGSLCVSCHMPARTYMVTDVRRDHSFRVPRPDFSTQHGTPNACNQCHTNKSSKWAADTVANWYGPGRRRESHFVEALDAGRRGLPQAEELLTSLINDLSKPAIARATALSMMPRYLSSASMPAVETGLKDRDPLVRMSALRALDPIQDQDRLRLAVPCLTDPVRSVRIEAARLLAGSARALSAPEQLWLNAAVLERVDAEMASAERPESHMNLGVLYTRMGRIRDAELELQTALRMDSRYVPAMVNLADLYRLQQREEEAQTLLEKAIAVTPEAAEPIHALGLLKVRLGKKREALDLLAKAATLQPASSRYAYVYGVALHSYGERGQAIAVLQKAYERRPADRDVLTALITFTRDEGNLRAAATYAEKLANLNPGDAQTLSLRNSLLDAASKASSSAKGNRP